MSSLLLPFLNLCILLALLGYYLRAPLKNFVSQRHILLRDELQKVRQQLHQAQEKYDEFSAKLKAIDAEVTSIKDQSMRDAQDMRTKISTDAKRVSGTIVSDARVAAEGLFGDLKHHLSSELGGRVLDRAEALLRERLTGDDRARIRMEFSRQVESIQ